MSLESVLPSPSIWWQANNAGPGPDPVRRPEDLVTMFESYVCKTGTGTGTGTLVDVVGMLIGPRITFEIAEAATAAAQQQWPGSRFCLLEGAGGRAGAEGGTCRSSLPEPLMPAQLSRGNTQDALFNALQHRLLETGTLHCHASLRQYWLYYTCHCDASLAGGTEQEQEQEQEQKEEEDSPL